jgi:hypothetical protein
MEELSQLEHQFNFHFLSVDIGHQPDLKNGLDAVRVTAAAVVQVSHCWQADAIQGEG